MRRLAQAEDEFNLKLAFIKSSRWKLQDFHAYWPTSPFLMQWPFEGK